MAAVIWIGLGLIVGGVIGVAATAYYIGSAFRNSM